MSYPSENQDKSEPRYPIRLSIPNRRKIFIYFSFKLKITQFSKLVKFMQQTIFVSLSGNAASVLMSPTEVPKRSDRPKWIVRF